MTFQDAFALVLPALLLLLAAGWLSSYIENAAYRLHGAKDADSLPAGQIEADFAQARLELVQLRDRRAELDNELSELHKERAALAGQEQALANAAKNFVAEAGYPVQGQPGFYIKLDGPASVMPFAGLASVKMPIGGRRQVRLVVWGRSPAEARSFALNWAGDGAKLALMRPFEGRLFWHEA